MIKRLVKAIRKRFRGIGKRGYTLIEVAAVVAVTAALTAVVVPVAVQKAKDSKLVGAKQDCVRIAEAITGFYKDTGEWPAYTGAANSRDTFHVLRSGMETEALGSAAHDPQKVIDKWSDNLILGNVDLLERHLVKDFPYGVQGAYLNVHKLNWKGPYAESFNKRDPWGYNYLVYVKAMHTPTTAGTGAGKEYGWIISAGPDGVMDTDVTDNSLQNDDIGVMLYAAEKGR